MDKKKINRYIGIIALLVLTAIIYFNFFVNKEGKGEINTPGVVIDNTDYSDLGVNPNDYEKFGDFLNDYENFSGSVIDLTNSNFVICKKNENGFNTYIPFYNDDIKDGYFDQSNYKNLAITDIYESHKDGCVAGGFGNDASKQIIFEKDIAHRDSKYLGDIFSGRENILDMKKGLLKFENLSKSSTELLSYLNDMSGEYEEANKLRSELCKKKPSTCDKLSRFKLYGKLTDENGIALSGVKITLLNDSNIYTLTNDEGEYILEFDYYPFAHLRFKANLGGYSDAFKTVSFNTYGKDSWEKRENADFVLMLPQNNYVINKDDKSLIITKNEKDYYELKSKQSTYYVPTDGLYLKNGNKWTGKTFGVNLYEFKKSDNVNDLVNVDTFDEVSGYVGNLMKTFGMPYIQFFDINSGEELFVKKSNPMILRNQIYHMKELYENYDKIYEAITKEDMEYLVQKSNELGGYPIDFDFLTKNNFLRWPVWWALDRKKGVWESIGSRVINTDGLVELPFYSISD